MLDLVLQALQTLFTPEHFVYLLLGVLLGLVIGIFPGLGGIAGLSLLLPFLYGMDEVSALATLIGLVAVIPTSATFTSVLMGIPGSSSSQATVLDGFALAKKGQASRALGAAFSSSLLGGLFGAIILTFFVQIARPMILLFGSAELFMLAIFGLSMVGSLSGKSLVKGVVACGFGILVGSIGAAPATGEFRMIFGINYLYDGLPLVVIALSIFAFPEISELFRKETAIAEGTSLGKGGMLMGVKDLIKNKWLALRCSGIGTIVGAIPGMGGSVVDWIAYGHVVQTSKDKSQFGKGDIRGVIAPESANNAKEGGALMPTLLFGIPGSGSMAVFLGGMVLIGIEAGPSMVTKDIDLTYTIIWSLAIANVIGAGLSLFLAGPISKLTKIKFSLLAPFMIMVISFAAFQATKDMMDLWMLLVFGMIGIFMKRFGWSRPAFLIGFVLATQAESYLNMSVQFYGWEMFWRPGVIIILLLSLISVYYSRKGTVDENAELMEKETPIEIDRKPQLMFAGLILVFIVIAIYDSGQQSFLGKVFTLSVAYAILPFAVWLIWILLKGKAANPAIFDAEQASAPGTFKAPWYEPILWIGGLYLVSVIIGFIPAIMLFFIAFFTIKAHTNVWRTALLTVAGSGVLLLFGYFLNLEFPQGVLF
ncbi:MAG: tripartite tricarboxylate transporter permease [Cyanothece sp. SIO1E1]|nr:tripartite tricarboxylate transporter permease [Cyanothece sp. SIO1E1]